MDSNVKKGEGIGLYSQYPLVKMRKIKFNNKGSVSVIVTVTILFFMVVLSTTYMLNAIMRQTQLKSQLALKDIYEGDLANAEEIYNNLGAYTLTIHYVTDAGTKLAEDYIGSYKEGDSYSIESPVIQKNDLMSVTTKVTISGEEVWVPAGYRIMEGLAETVNDGVVITDIATKYSTEITTVTGIMPNNNLEVTVKYKEESGNEWVWVPVPDATVMYVAETTKLTIADSVTTPYYSKSEIISGQIRVKPGDTSDYREPDLITGWVDLENGLGGTEYDYSNYSTAGFSSLNDMATKIVADYKQMIESIAKYKGFYIGRYELTANGTKAGAPLTNTNWYTLYANCKSLSVSEAAVTRMIWGCQWDVTCNWLADNGFDIDDSSSWGNYQNSTGNAAVDGYGALQNTGYSEFWKANNIYDFAGNFLEWTQEAYSTYYRASRGGSYDLSGSSFPASIKVGWNGPTASNFSNVSSRPTLIVTP